MCQDERRKNGVSRSKLREFKVNEKEMVNQISQIIAHSRPYVCLHFARDSMFSALEI